MKTNQMYKHSALLLRMYLLSLVLALGACASQPLFKKVGPEFNVNTLRDSPSSTQAKKWFAALPAPHGASTASMAMWWSQLNDSVLDDLIASAQIQSPSISASLLRVQQARNGMAQVDAGKLPSLDASLGTSRSAFTFGGPVALRTQTQAQLLANWEIDLFGAKARETEAAAARIAARAADWHDSRVTVAAETANAYVQYRFCEQQIKVLEADSKSRDETSRLTEVAAKAGFQPMSSAAVLRASAADARRRLITQKAECQIALKGMVALTAMDEAALIKKLQPKTAILPTLKTFDVPDIPANILLQRPDIASAEFEVAAASADIGVSESAKYPRLSLSGSITPLRLMSGGNSLNATTWSIGPALSIPLFDGGRRAANSELSKQVYANAEHSYRSRVRQAVREVEEALVRIELAANRKADTETAARGFKEAFQAAQSKWQVGIGNLLELEDARRQQLAADVETGILQRDLMLAWIGLYRAAGGGWDSSTK